MLARPATVIATLLIGTNIATNAATSAVGLLLTDRGLPGSGGSCCTTS